MRVETPDGEVLAFGTTETTPTIGIIDRSRLVTDAFGHTTVTERGFARRLSMRMAVPFDEVDSVQNRLADLRATAATWIADDRFEWLSVRGFYKDFALDLAVPPLSYCSLNIEGLTSSEPVNDLGGDPAPASGKSTLQLLQPTVVTSTMLVASSVPQTDYAEWSAGAIYALGSRVIKAATHRVYESAAAENFGNDPAGASGKWIDAGSTNRWAMFDQALGSRTVATDSITITLAAGAVNAIALLDVAAISVRVQAARYDRTALASSGSVTFLDLPATTGQVTVTITGGGTGGGQVSVGTLLIGKLVGLGITEANPTAAITDYSLKEADDFGEFSVVERAWAKRMTARALIRTDALDVVANRIAAVRARPSLWIGKAGLSCLTIYGFFTDFSIEVGEHVSKLSLAIKGMSEAPRLLGGGSASNAALEELRREVERISSDDWLSRSEKPQVVIAHGALLLDYDAIEASHIANGSPAAAADEYAAAQAKLVALNGYLTSLDPEWSDASEDTPIVAATYQIRWTEAYATVAAFRVAVRGGKGDPGQPGAPGAAAFGLTGSGDVIVEGNALVKTANGGWGSGGGFSREGFPGGAQCSFKAGQYNADLMVGLNSDPATNNSFETIDYAWNLNADGNATIYESGVHRGVLIEGFGAGTFQVGYNNRKVRYLYNGVTYREVDAPANLTLHFDAALTGPEGVSLIAIAFAAAGSAGQDGSSAPLIKTQWSVDGTSGWHDDFTSGDIYYRQSNDDGVTWGPPIQGVGEGSVAGIDGVSPSNVYFRSATVPATPFDNSGNPPTGWTDGPYEGDGFLWMAKANFRGPTQLTSWSVPQRISGEKGDPGPSLYTWHAYANSPNGTLEFTTGAPGTRAYEGRADNKASPAESDDPDDYAWREYRGPPFGLATRGVAVVAGAQVIKDGGTEAWNSDAYSTVSYRGGAAASFRGTGNQNVMAGLNTDPTTDTSFSSLDHAWYLQDDGFCRVYESGVAVTGTMFAGYGTGLFQVAYDDEHVSYLYNGLLAHRTLVGPGKNFHFDSSLYTPNGRITDIDFVPAGAKGADGADAPLVRTQWSVNGTSGWHADYAAGDRYYRQSNDGGATWGPAILGVGESGSGPSNVYRRSATIPATPATNSGNPPTGWTDGPTDGVDYLWMCKATFRDGIQLAAWSTPQRISGEPGADGQDGFSVDTETTNFNQSVFSSGANKPSWTGGSGTIRLNKGGQTITAGVTYAVLNNSGVAGLSLTGQTFSFAGAIGDVGAFTIRATYDGVPYDKVVAVKKVYDGEAAFTGAATLSGTNFVEAADDTPVPAGRACIVSAAAGYQLFNTVVQNFQATLYLYWRNVTDNGGWNLLGSNVGSMATARDTGTAQEPEWVFTGGSVSGAFAFTAPSPNKQIGYRALVQRTSGTGDATIEGVFKLEVQS